MDIKNTVAENVKKLREQRKLTLDTAAEITGVSRSMLAQLERGDVNPTISVLWKIANGYKVSFTSLIEEAGDAPDVIREAQPILEDGGRYLNYPVFSFDKNRLFETYRIIIKENGHLEADAHLVGSEEYITVFAGDVEITVDDAVYTLGEGDSIRFFADRPHSYKNIGKSEASLGMLIYYNK